MPILKARDSHWLDAALSIAMLLACSSAGLFIVTAKSGPDRAGAARRTTLESYWPGGVYVNAAIYRVCLDGRYWYVRIDGGRYDTGETCRR